uniref:Zinc finger and BTB domain containing 40 n=1 Tax=Astyanax mexicanus TaxID=7994 RepID=A0A8B9GZ89_ASTMX
MELPNYSRQLLQQLQALRKEGQFCDCTILVEGAAHPAHKVVLAASSLLFKSLLESSDSISIDSAVVTSQEFSSLLDMVYLGRLPPGKHNFTRVIAAADSLQMFDVAVGCKNILNDLVKLVQPNGAQGLKAEQADLQVNDPSGERGGAAELAESMQQVLDRVLNRDVHHVPQLCRLLTMSQQSFPQLSLLTEELNQADLITPSQDAGSEKEEDEEEEEEDEGDSRQTALQRKGVAVSYSCDWCNKSFDFKCRLLRHRKRCAMSPDKAQHCTDCSQVFPSLTALQQHCSQAHGAPSAKKRKTQPVACELCGKTFKHPSGLLYHKRTEHLEERPYVCEECGAKFSANSSLKNHMRLHTGEKPYQCKHCDMSFTVAAALSYHTKKKHAEGKMYSCQYCSSTFAQSIELTRHVRTHTGDKPYVCRECGKGFRQANGLSVHLQTFHNVAEPHDCQKCRVSFGSLDELREHIQEVHPKELHQCPECSRILSTAAQLEKHMSIHDGSKPYSCKSCNKSYQVGQRPLINISISIINLYCLFCIVYFVKTMIIYIKWKECNKIKNLTKIKSCSLWRCVYCGCAASSEEELQQHVSSEHVSQQGSVFGCVVCSLTFSSESEFQHHFLTTHLQVIQEEEPTQMVTSPFQMVSVIHTQDTSAVGAEQISELDQSQMDCSQQVFVALGDGGESAAGSEIVAVNMEDLLTGRVTLICEENQ